MMWVFGFAEPRYKKSSLKLLSLIHWSANSKELVAGAGFEPTTFGL